MTPFELSASDALAIVRSAGELRAVGARRFPTGLAHFVFEVDLADGTQLVLRAGRPDQRQAMSEGIELQEHLRPLGVPLPAILATSFNDAAPWILMERLAGSDLGHVVGRLPPSRLEEIAAIIARTQAAVAGLGPAPGYGYAVKAEAAPLPNWRAVLVAHLERSRRRLASSGLFSCEWADLLNVKLERFREELAAVPATPFLHDTTTKNVIITPDGAFSGIVDVDDLCFGDPRYVIALTSVALLTRGFSQHYVYAWMAAGGYADDALFDLYKCLFLLDFMSEHGQRFNGNQPPSTAEARADLLALFECAIEQLNR